MKEGNQGNEAVSLFQKVLNTILRMRHYRFCLVLVEQIRYLDLKQKEFPRDNLVQVWWGPKMMGLTIAQMKTMDIVIVAMGRVFVMKGIKEMIALIANQHILRVFQVFAPQGFYAPMTVVVLVLAITPVVHASVNRIEPEMIAQYPFVQVLISIVTPVMLSNV